MNKIPLLAIDAGGTSCRAVLSNTKGEILSFAKGGSSNFHNIGLEKTKDTLIKVLKELVAPINEKVCIQKAVIGMAALDTDSAYDTMMALFKEIFLLMNLDIEEIILGNDGFVTLMGTLGKRPGLLVISGTGSIVCGKDKENNFTRVGGWGHRLGDEGSGFNIGKAALQHIAKSIDGRESPTVFTEAILKSLNLNSFDELMSWVYSPYYSIDKVASLARDVFQLASQDHPVAKRILLESSIDLAEACETVIQKLGLYEEETFELIASGGILQNDSLVFDNIIEILSNKYRNFTFRKIDSEPIYCAILYGLHLMNEYTHDAEVKLLENLKYVKL